MRVDRTRAVVVRILRQLRADRRTLAQIFIVPPMLLGLLSEIFSSSPLIFNRVGPLMLGLFPFLIMFLLSSVAVLRERTQGTLDRLLASPIGRGDLIGGYAIAYGLVGLAQAVVTMTVGLWLLDLPNAGNLWPAFLLVLLQAVLGVALGLCLSALARNEFQAVQFLPAVVLPQFLVAGLLVPLEQLPDWLEVVARFMPLTYAFEAIDRIMLRGHDFSDTRLVLDLLVVAGLALVLLAVGALTLRRAEA